MAFNEKNVYQGVIPSTLSTLVTFSKKTELVDFHLSNITASGVTVNLYVDVDGNIADANSAVLYGFYIPANDYHHWTGRILVSSGGTLQAVASASNAISLIVTGAELE